MAKETAERSQQGARARLFVGWSLFMCPPLAHSLAFVWSLSALSRENTRERDSESVESAVECGLVCSRRKEIRVNSQQFIHEGGNNRPVRDISSMFVWLTLCISSWHSLISKQYSSRVTEPFEISIANCLAWVVKNTFTITNGEQIAVSEAIVMPNVFEKELGKLESCGKSVSYRVKKSVK